MAPEPGQLYPSAWQHPFVRHGFPRGWKTLSPVLARGPSMVSSTQKWAPGKVVGHCLSCF